MRDLGRLIRSRRDRHGDPASLSSPSSWFLAITAWSIFMLGFALGYWMGAR